MKPLFLTCLLSVAALACGSDPAAAGDVGASRGGGTGEGGTSGSGGTGRGGEAGETGEAGAGATGGAVGAAGAAGDGGGGGSGEPSYECTGPGARFATSVRDHQFGSGQTHGQDTFPAPVLGPPSGGGCCMGSLEVTSLGDGGFVVLEFEGNVIVDGPGADFIVFENPFFVDEQDPSSVFAEIAKVSVSSDGQDWTEYPCTASEYPFDGCAGWHPVLADGEATALDPATAGGDAFDLADVGLPFARYVRIDDRTMPDDLGATFDLDSVAIVNPGCP